MHLLVALITLPLTSVVSMEETRAAQGAAVRSPIGRSFRHRPPIIITPHVFKVFDVRIARAEILGVKSKYRDAERILKGVGLNPLIELPEVYKSKEGWKNRIGNDTLGRDLDNHTFNHLDARNNNLEAFWIDDLLPDVEDHTPPTNASLAYVVGKRRCADEIGNGNGAVCDIPPSSSSEESGHEIQDQPASPGSAPLSVIPDNITAPSIPLTGSGSGSDQRDTAHMRVLNYIVGGLDVLYYGSLEFGSPPQGIMLDIDTGSADLWVPTKCSSCDTKQFDSGRSVSFEDTGKPFKATYGSGWAEGTQAQESVSLGSFSVEGQYIGAVTEVSEDFRGSPASGVLGMAFGSISTVKEATFFENLIATTQVTAPLFGVHLTRGKEYGSELCMGCINTSKFSGEIYWVPVKSKTYWSVEMTGYSLGGSPELFSAPITAAIDTGSTLIYLPIHEADALYHHVPGSRQAPEFGEAIWAFPCSSRLELSLRFGAKLFQIHPWDFNLGRTDAESDECVGGILGLPEGFPSDFAIIGDEFLKSWYSVYDYADNGKIGLAYSTNNK